jgi:hypothetical protein
MFSIETIARIYVGAFLIDASHAVEGFGEARAPRDFHFLVVFTGIGGKYHQKRMILGGFAALQASH